MCFDICELIYCHFNAKNVVDYVSVVRIQIQIISRVARAF